MTLHGWPRTLAALLVGIGIGIVIGFQANREPVSDPTAARPAPAPDSPTPPAEEDDLIESAPEEPEEGAAASGSSFATPVPFGQTGQLGSDWEFRVLDTLPDAWDAVYAENEFNDPPKKGHQFFMARIAATYIGSGKGTVFSDLYLQAIGAGQTAYEDYGDATCGVVPDDINDKGDVFPGGTVKGNVCWSVKTTDVNTLKLIAEDQRENLLFMELNPK